MPKKCFTLLNLSATLTSKEGCFGLLSFVGVYTESLFTVYLGLGLIYVLFMVCNGLCTAHLMLFCVFVGLCWFSVSLFPLFCLLITPSQPPKGGHTLCCLLKCERR